METNFYSVSEYLYRILNYNEAHKTDLKDMAMAIQPAVIAEAPERRDAAYDEKVMEFYGRHNKKILKAYHNETQAEFARQVEELYQEYQGELGCLRGQQGGAPGRRRHPRRGRGRQ